MNEHCHWLNENLALNMYSICMTDNILYDKTDFCMTVLVL